MNTSGKSHIGKLLTENLRSKGYDAKYVHAFSEYTIPGKRFYAMGFFENPLLQTEFLLEDLALRINHDLANCEIGIIDRYVQGILLYQKNKTNFIQGQEDIERLVKQNCKSLPIPDVTFILEISYDTLCKRYLKRYNALPKKEHESYLKKLISDFANAEGIHIDNNINLDFNVLNIAEITGKKL